MALRKPLVISNGVIEQIQSGDTVDGNVQEVDVFAMTNESGGSIAICSPVYCSSANLIAKADASGNAATAKVVGLLKATTANEATGNVQTNGVVSATTGEWDAVTGDSGGLTAGTVYYLDTTAGLLTTTAPSGSGNYVTWVGVGITATEMMLSIDEPIKL